MAIFKKICIIFLLVLFSGLFLFSNSNPAIAIDDTIYTNLKNAPNEDEAIRLIYKIGNISQGYNFAQGIQEIEKLHKIAKTLPFKSAEIYVYLNYSVTYINHLDFASAHKYTDKAILYAKENKLRRGHADALQHKAWIYDKTGEYDKMFEYLMLALSIYEKINDKQKIGQCYYGLGHAQYNSEQINQANENYEKAKQILGNNIEDWQAQVINNNMALIHKRKKNYDSAILTFNNTIQQISKKKSWNIDDTSRFAYTLYQIGESQYKKSNWDSALYYFDKSLKFYPFATAVEKSTVSAVYNGIGYTYLAKKNYTNAALYFDSALYYANLYHYYFSYPNAYLGLSKLNEEQNKHKEANNYLRLYVESRDSILKISNPVRLYELQSQFEIGKKDEEIKINEKELHYKRNQVYLLLGIILVAIIFSIFIFLQRAKLIKKNTQLVTLNQEVTQKNEEIQSQSELLKMQKEELEQKKNQLEEVNKMKDQFFSIIGHDLRNPFAVLLSSAEMLIRNLEKYDKDKSQRYLQLIYDSAKRSHTLLENLLLWAKSQLGSIQFKCEKNNLNKISESIISFLRSHAEQNSVIITNHIPDFIELYADKNMLETILRNLITNAIKFTQNGTIDIKVALDQKRQWAEISIIDSGVGIKKENLEKLFRIDISQNTLTSYGDKGTGLGLILCKEFVEKHGGKITVESQLKKGSTFAFTLPVYHGQDLN